MWEGAARVLVVSPDDYFSAFFFFLIFPSIAFLSCLTGALSMGCSVSQIISRLCFLLPLARAACTLKIQGQLSLGLVATPWEAWKVLASWLEWKWVWPQSVNGRRTAIPEDNLVWIEKCDPWRRRRLPCVCLSGFLDPQTLLVTGMTSGLPFTLGM